MRKRRPILGWIARASLVALAVVGLTLLCVPGIARGLGRPDEASPWSLNRPALDRLPSAFMADAGLQVGPRQIDRNRQKWANLSDADRARLMAMRDRMERADIEARQVLVERYQQLSKLSDKERAALREQAELLARFEATLGRQDLAVLEALPPADRAKALVKLWRERQGLE